MTMETNNTPELYIDLDKICEFTFDSESESRQNIKYDMVKTILSVIISPETFIDDLEANEEICLNTLINYGFIKKNN